MVRQERKKQLRAARKSLLNTRQKNESNAKTRLLVDILSDTGIENTLLKSVLDVKEQEHSSFHMPGHKGRLDFSAAASVFSLDTTELPGLDDLTFPNASIGSIESNLASAYGVKESIISLGGASHGIIASILSICRAGDYLLAPRNAHRSIVNGAVLSGLDIVWYDPFYDESWSFWGAVLPAEIEKQLNSQKKCAAVVVTSPTYAGAISDISRISEVCKRFKAPLIVDEAHGAHFLPASGLPRSACQQNADIVVHSLHKTLPGLTQTGVVHLPSGSSIAASGLRQAMRMLTTSSPSYPLLISVEMVANLCLNDRFKSALKKLASDLACFEKELQNIDGLELYASSCGFDTDPFHLALRIDGVSGVELCNYFESKGVFVESNLGNSVLLLAGAGSNKSDFEFLLKVAAGLGSLESSGTQPSLEPTRLVQKMNPRDAFFATCEMVDLNCAAGRIAAECIAPCPPGVPVIAPGALIPHEISAFRSMIGKVRVVKE